MSTPRGPIVLATDFGDSPYVGQIKGVIASIAPDAHVIDLTHQVAPQDIVEGLWHLKGALAYFPRGTIFVAVVDPGVGTARRALCVDAGDFLAVGPDNGILSFIAPEKRRAVHLIEAEEYTLRKKSAVFHGRDIFAPAAAHLANGLDPAKLGPAGEGVIELPWIVPRATKDGLEGAVLVVDRFGNLLTNIEGHRAAADATVTIEKTPIGSLRTTYSDAEVGRPLALIGSSGFIEIAIRNGSAAKGLGLGKGARVSVKGAR
ncbi:MAG: SAM-dependent chlorinase/fluorinase [Planctomycetes bacterium]|nr:SAM-dependent chlorinase/fluorinase [Planctomycetota bacterium]